MRELAEEAKEDPERGPGAAPGAQDRTLPGAHSGRFYNRRGPDSTPILTPGDELKEGTVLGLIEVMKNFANVSYQPGKGLPGRVRLVAWVAENGAEVGEGDPLLEFEITRIGSDSAIPVSRTLDEREACSLMSIPRRYAASNPFS